MFAANFQFKERRSLDISTDVKPFLPDAQLRSVFLIAQDVRRFIRCSALLVEESSSFGERVDEVTNLTQFCKKNKIL
jgi:hypothetical protein